MARGDQALDLTRRKLIESAGQAFAEAGFHKTTVRKICARTGASVAAVNYHFGDKLGLYMEVLTSSMLAQQAAALSSSMAYPSEPREALRALICEWFKTIHQDGKPSWFARIIAHEMAQPTPALDRAAEAMGANYLQLRTLVGKLIRRGPNDARTRLCVHSVVGQVLHYVTARPMLARLWPDLKLDNEEQRRAIAEHIVAFSLAGMESGARLKPERRRRKKR